MADWTARPCPAQRVGFEALTNQPSRDERPRPLDSTTRSRPQALQDDQPPERVSPPRGAGATLSATTRLLYLSIFSGPALGARRYVLDRTASWPQHQVDYLFAGSSMAQATRARPDLSYSTLKTCQRRVGGSPQDFLDNEQARYRLMTSFASVGNLRRPDHHLGPWIPAPFAHLGLYFPGADAAFGGKGSLEGVGLCLRKLGPYGPFHRFLQTLVRNAG